MPFRIFLRLIFLIGLGAPYCAFALGLGSLEVHSALNQNFDAEIPLISNNPAEIVGLKVQLPPRNVFDRVGVERLDVLSLLRFNVQSKPNGSSVIKVTSLQPLRNPSFQVLLEAVWPRGRILREYNVQLDPRLYSERREPPPPPEPVVELQVTETPSAAPDSGLPEAPSVSFEGASSYVVRAGDSLSKIARRVRPSSSVSVSTMMSVLLAGNPDAFAGGNPNRLRSGVVLKVPTAKALGVEGVPPSTLAQPPAILAAAPSAVESSTRLPPVEFVAPELSTAPVPVTEGLLASSEPSSSLPTTEPPATSELPPIDSSVASAPLPLLPTEPPVASESLLPPLPTDSSVASAPLLPPAEPSEPLLPPTQPPLASEPLLPPVETPLPLEPLPGESPLPPVSESPLLSPVGSAENLQEIIPEASVPQTALPTADQQEATDAVESEPVPEPTPEPQPIVKSPIKPAIQQPVIEESAWWANPIVWIPIILIVLAIAAVLLLPLLRRRLAHSPEEPNSVAIISEGDSADSEPLSTKVSRPERPVTTRRTVVHTDGDGQPSQPSEAAAAEIAAAAAATKTQVKRTSRPSIPQPPKPIDDLLKDIDFGLGDATPKPSEKDAAPVGKAGMPPLPDLEPPTSSVTETPTPSGVSDPSPATPDPKPTAEKKPDLPSSLRLDDMAFDFDSLGLDSTSRPAEEKSPPPKEKAPAPGSAGGLPPLELKLDKPLETADSALPQETKPAAPDSGSLDALEFDLGNFEPPTAAPPAEEKKELSSSRQDEPKKEDLKFEFTDITQDIGGKADDLRLDEDDLKNFGGDSLDLGQIDDGLSGGDSSTSYLETKLDLAVAYLDMDDRVGARSLLDEVLRDGDADQKKRAQEMIKKLD